MLALKAGSDHLSCRCDNPDCPAAVDDCRASSVVVHVIAEQATTETLPDPQLNGEELAPNEAPEPAARRTAALIAGGGPVPASLLAELIARGAKVKLVGSPGQDPEPQYRPSKALDEFVRIRDLTCRYPGCDRPALYGDIDHTVAYPDGPTHAGNIKCYCRKHHLLKTFPPWRDHQHPNGTVIWTSPAGQTYTTQPGCRLLFPTLCRPTAPIAPIPTDVPSHQPARTLKMPRRTQTRAHNRARAIQAERKLNDSYVTERNRPPPF